MMVSPENILLAGSLLLLTSILAGKTSSRFGVPTLILFLIVGILAGSEGIGNIYFDDPNIAQFVGITALNFILFSGGLDTNWETIRPVVWRGISLSTIGVFITALAVGLFVHFFFNFTLLEGLLLGAIVSATDAAAVFSILRSRGVKLKGKVGSVLEFESGSNDPMAYFLTVSLTGIIATGHFDGLNFIFHFFKEFMIGAAMGYAMGRLSHWLINNIKLDSDGLYPVLVLGLAMFTYSATHVIGGNGFLAIYLSALILGNRDFIHKRSLVKFYDGQAWLMQIVLFLTLGLFVYPSEIVPVMGAGLLISAFLIFVARPAGVFTALAFSSASIRSKLFISWVGLRGGVPIVFATYPLIAGLGEGRLIFNLVFFIAISSVILQGTTLPLMAKWLRVTEPPAEVSDDAAPGTAYVADEMKEMLIAAGSKAIGKRIVDLHFPPSVHILSIKRNGQYIQPTGSDKLLEGDHLMVLSGSDEDMEEFADILDIK
ncbi:MAG: potassium/proton antiporter [Chitinophagaceae bacterium]|nr:potassium/proton antiporter [Chitinophagaceae bacterium]